MTNISNYDGKDIGRVYRDNTLIINKQDILSGNPTGIPRPQYYVCNTKGDIVCASVTGIEQALCRIIEELLNDN